RALGGHYSTQHVSTSAEAVQEGRVLLQAVSPSGSVHLGHKGTKRRDHRSICSASSNVVRHLQGTIGKSREVLDGCARAGPSPLHNIDQAHNITHI
ncbi:oxysterol-binding protein, partial [Plakobranchus ocellatus]